MPNVPIYSSPTIAPTALPGVRQQTPYRQMQAAMIGPQEETNLGNALTAAGGEMLREVTLDQIQTNEAAAKDYDARQMASNQGVVNEFLKLQGKNALDSYDAAAKKIGEIPQELTDGLTNPAQQQLVKHTAEMRALAAKGQLDAHKLQQASVYEDAASQTRIKVAQDSAATAFNPVTDAPAAKFDHENPTANTAYQQYLQTIRSEAEDRADRKGLNDPDLRAAFVKDSMAKAYVNTLGHLIDKKGGTPADMKVAQGYFDAVKDELPVEQQDKIRAVLEEGAAKDKAIDLAITLGAKGGLSSQKKILDGMKTNGEINGTVYDMALQHLRATDSDRRVAQGEADHSLLGNVWDIARNGGKITDLSPSQLAYIKQRGLGTNIDAIFKQAEPGGAAGPDDSKLFSDLSRMSAENPAGFIAMDLSTMSGQLSQAHWNHLVGVQTSINRQDVKGMEANKVVHTAIQDVKASLLAAGFDLTPKEGSESAKNLEKFDANVRDQLIAAQTTWQERKLNPAQIREEARKIALGALKDETLTGTGFSVNGSTYFQTKLPIWKMSSEQRTAQWDISDADRTRIKAQLTAGGMPSSEANIQQYYKLEKGVTK